METSLTERFVLGALVLFVTVLGIAALTLVLSFVLVLLIFTPIAYIYLINTYVDLLPKPIHEFLGIYLETLTQGVLGNDLRVTIPMIAGGAICFLALCFQLRKDELADTVSREAKVALAQKEERGYYDDLLNKPGLLNLKQNPPDTEA